MTVKNSDDHSENPELTQLISRPNASCSKNSFMESIVSYMLLAGNAFVYIDDNRQLQCLRPDRVQIVPNRFHTEAEYYSYNIDNMKYKIEKCDILHLKFFNPLNDWYGFSPLQAAAQAIDQYNEMSKHNLAILQNGGRPSGCFIVKNDQTLSEEQIQQLRADIQDTYTGSKKAGKILLLYGGLEWKEMGLSPKDLDFESGRNLAIREIAQAFGVPPILLGIECNASFNSYKEARLNFWEDTILPIADYIKEEFSQWLSNQFGRRVELVLDLDAVHALMPKRESLWNKIANADFLSTDEKRQLLGYPKEKSKGEKNVG